MSACPDCRFFNSHVNETRRLRNGWVRRHRACHQPECGRRWYTYEIPTEAVHADVNSDDLKELTK